MTKRIAEMTPEQLAREQQRRKCDAYREYHREYRRNRYANDAEFREQLKEQKRLRADPHHEVDRSRCLQRRCPRRRVSHHVAAWWWDASLLTTVADENLLLIKTVTRSLPFDWGSNVRRGGLVEMIELLLKQLSDFCRLARCRFGNGATREIGFCRAGNSRGHSEIVNALGGGTSYGLALQLPPRGPRRQAVRRG